MALVSRQLKILGAIIESQLSGQTSTVNEIRALTGTSLATVYKDIEGLSRLKVLRDRGALVLTDDVEQHRPQRLDLRAVVKAAIAERLVRDLLAPGCVLYLDTGTTCWHVARELVRQRRDDVTVVTANPYAVSCLADEGTVREVVVLGGTLRASAASLFGSLTATGLRQVSFDTAVISVDFVHTDAAGSLATFSDAETAQKGLACERATDNVCVIADDSKLSRNLGHVFASLSRLTESKRTSLVVGTEHDEIPRGVRRQLKAALGAKGALIVAGIAEAAPE